MLAQGVGMLENGRKDGNGPGREARVRRRLTTLTQRSATQQLGAHLPQNASTCAALDLTQKPFTCFTGSHTLHRFNPRNVSGLCRSRWLTGRGFHAVACPSHLPTADARPLGVRVGTA